MQNKKIIYRVFKSIPHHDHEYGELTLHIEVKDRSSDKDQIFITWQHNYDDSKNWGWYACKIEWKRGGNELFPLLTKIKNFNADAKVVEVLEFLHNNNIEHAIWAKIYDDQQKEIFYGSISTTEIIAGKFKRRYYEKPLKILPQQQQDLLKRLTNEIDISMPQRKVA